jgi:hypothetical protein
MTRKTKFGVFLENTGIDRRLVSFLAGVSMDHVIRMCYSESTNGPTLRTIISLLSACSTILRRKVKIEELFDMKDGGERRGISSVLNEILNGGATGRPE